MLSFLKGLVVPRFLYSLLLLSLMPVQWDQLETVLQVALGVCLGISRFAGNMPTLCHQAE